MLWKDAWPFNALLYPNAWLQSMHVTTPRLLLFCSFNNFAFRTLQNKKILDSVTTKIVGQITCKLGGELWKVKIPLSKTMVVGIDLTHDKTRGRYVYFPSYFSSRLTMRRDTVAGFTASINETCTRYYSEGNPATFETIPNSFQQCASKRAARNLLMACEHVCATHWRCSVIRTGNSQAALSYIVTVSLTRKWKPWCEANLLFPSRSVFMYVL